MHVLHKDVRIYLFQLVFLRKNILRNALFQIYDVIEGTHKIAIGPRKTPFFGKQRTKIVQKWVADLAHMFFYVYYVI